VNSTIALRNLAIRTRDRIIANFNALAQVCNDHYWEFFGKACDKAGYIELGFDMTEEKWRDEIQQSLDMLRKKLAQTECALGVGEDANFQSAVELVLGMLGTNCEQIQKKKAEELCPMRRQPARVPETPARSYMQTWTPSPKHQIPQQTPNSFSSVTHRRLFPRNEDRSSQMGHMRAPTTSHAHWSGIGGTMSNNSNRTSTEASRPQGPSGHHLDASGQNHQQSSAAASTPRQNESRPAYEPDITWPGGPGNGSTGHSNQRQ